MTTRTGATVHLGDSGHWLGVNGPALGALSLFDVNQHFLSNYFQLSSFDASSKKGEKSQVRELSEYGA